MTLTIEELKYGAEVGDLGIEAVRAVCAEALANREAQPVGEIHTVAESRNPGVNIHMFNSEKIIPNGTKLYTAPPTPAVPTFEEWILTLENKPLGWVRDSMKESYDACRAAMLEATSRN